MRRSSPVSRGGLVLLALVAVSFAGCGGESGTCESGDVQDCSCDDGSGGTQTCEPSGDGWSDCDCSSTDGDADSDADGDGDGDGDGDACVPDCDGRVCGDDGCGESCGDCDVGETCTDDGLCENESVCGHQPSLPTCEEVNDPPSDDVGVIDFSADNAIPLVCTDGGEPVWELDVFIDDFAGMRLFMMGETHGSNEIGPGSVALFSALYDEGLVEAVALEIGMDTTDAMNTYVETGGGDFLTVYGTDALGENMFRRVFPDEARRRYLDEGTVVELFGVDYPQRLAWVNEELVALSELIADADLRAMVTDTMPEPREQDEYGMLGLPTDYVTSAETYYESIMSDLDTICAELPTDSDCDRLEHLAYALWIGAIFNSQDFMLEMMSGGTHIDEWMDLREELIYWNYQQIVGAVEGGVYAHMGSAHVAKGGSVRHVAEMMNEDFEATADGVYTVTPAYGPGSRIFYTIATQPVPEEPEQVSAALADAVVDNYYLSTTRPGFDCTGNPFEDLYTSMGLPGTTYGHWDAFFWFRQLTPDVPAGAWGKITLSPVQASMLENWRRTQVADEAMTRSHR